MTWKSQAARQIAEAKAIETETGCLPREQRYSAYAALAEREARAILAETEPGESIPVRFDAYLCDLHAGQALAESLAAFVS